MAPRARAAKVGEAPVETQQQDILAEGEAEMLKTEAEGEWDGDYIHRPDGTWGHRACTAECRQDLNSKRTASSHARFAHGVKGTTRPKSESGGRRSARQLASVATPGTDGMLDDFSKMMETVQELTAEVRRLWKVEEAAERDKQELAEARRAQTQLRRALNEVTGDLNQARQRGSQVVHRSGALFSNPVLSRAEMERLQRTAPEGR